MGSDIVDKMKAWLILEAANAEAEAKSQDALFGNGRAGDFWRGGLNMAECALRTLEALERGEEQDDDDQ